MKQPVLPVVAVVGGIGSGKSVVARELASRGGFLIQGDELGHEALRQPEIRDAAAQTWGARILDENGQIVRRRLGEIVFANPAELRRLEALVFPYIGRRIAEERDRASRTPGVRFVVLDAAVILEAGWRMALDRLIYVDAPRLVRLERLKARGWDEGELARREAVQLSCEEKRRRADAIIDNSKGLEETRRQLDCLLREWKLQ